MPSGKTHDRITLWGLPWIVVLGLLFTRDATLVLIISGTYLFGGLMFGPDLDIHSVQFKRWGWFRWLWLPYQKSIRHRSRLSHGFLIGTTLRILYLTSLGLLLTMVGIAIAQLLLGFDWNWQAASQYAWEMVQQHRDRVGAAFLGLELGAMSHSCADWLGSRLKRWQRQQKATKKRPQSRKRKSKP